MSAIPDHLPNPTTPLAWLDPALADQLEVSRYLLVATCGMFSWDILINLRNDWKLLRRYRVRFPTIAYFVSRLASFSFIISSTAFLIGPVGNCQTLQIALGWCVCLAIQSTSLLFFLRVKAIFNDNKPVVIFFAFMWLASLAGSMTVPFALGGAHIGTTNHCINVYVKQFSFTPGVINTTHDTLVFLFVSYRLLADSTNDESWRDRFRSFFRGKGLPAFSWALLQNGQKYYLVTIGFNVLSTGMILAPKTIPPSFHVMFIIPNIAITNTMACWVFRDVKFGLISSDGSTLKPNLPTVRFAISDSDQTISFGTRQQQLWHIQTSGVQNAEDTFGSINQKAGTAARFSTHVQQNSIGDSGIHEVAFPHTEIDICEEKV